MKGIGIGGLTAISLSNTTTAQAQEILDNDDARAADPHALDTYRSIVDAIIPETPELGQELGREHIPGGLDVELEEFLIFDYNHFQEIRLETITDEGVNQERLELLLDIEEAPSELAALAQLVDSDFLGLLEGGDLGGVGDTLTDGDVVDAVDELLDIDTDLEAMEEALDFGTVEQLEVALADGSSPGDEGPAEFETVVQTAEGTVTHLTQNYPYANLFAIVFDIVAADFIAQGGNQDDLESGEEFPAGGTFVRLSREDRLRALSSIYDGSTIDRLDEILTEFMVTDVGILKFVVMATYGLHGFGYYTEWSGLGETRTNPPRERELEVGPDEVQSRTQTDYPGPADGYAVDWRHVIDGDFDDPDVEDLDLGDDLEGDDILDDISGSDGFDSPGAPTNPFGSGGDA